MTDPVRHLRDLPTEPVKAGTRTTRQILTEPGAGAGFHIRRFVIEPGGGMPRHRNAIEHQQYVVRGAARVGIGDKTFRVEAGAVVHIPAGSAHWYAAEEGDEPFEFLCVVPDAPDRIELIEE